MIIGASGQAEAEPAKQIVVIRGNRSTKAAIKLVPGDQVAYLSVRNAPDNLLRVLRRQTGPALVDVERIELIRKTITVALRMESESYKVEVRKLKKQRGSFSIVFTPDPSIPTIDPQTLVGRVPEAPPKAPWPFVPPPKPRRHPCTRFPKTIRIVDMLDDNAPPPVRKVISYARNLPDRMCADYLQGRVAARQLKVNGNLDDLSAWAFPFSKQDRWATDRYAYSYTAMVAAGVLLRTDFIPEVEVLLGTDRIQGSERLVPYRALLMSDLMAAQQKPGTSRRLLRALVKPKMQPVVRHAAALRMIDLTTKQGPKEAKAFLRTILPSLPARSRLRNEVALRSGELAIAVGDIRQAQALFREASKAKVRRVRSHAYLRLGDLAARKSVRRALALYKNVDRRERCLDNMARLRRILLDKRDLEILEQNVLDAVTNPECAGHALDARYAMAELSLVHDEFEYAMKLVDGARKYEDDRWSSKATFDALATRILSLTAGRLYRNRNWDELARVYRTRLKSRRDTLSAPTLLQLADGLNRVGLHASAADLLRSSLQRIKPGPELDKITIALADSYVRDGKFYLAEVVLNYFRRRRSRFGSMWKVSLIRAALFLRQQNGEAALRALAVADKSTPAGDPKIRATHLRAQAQHLVGNADAAANDLMKVLSGDWHPSLKTRGLGVNVLSQCLLECQPKNLERLLKDLEAKGYGELISPRIRYLSQKRLGRKTKPDEGSVWDRLEAAVPGVKVDRETKPRGESR